MKIIVNKEEVNIVHSLCDLAMRHGGINALNVVNAVVASIVVEDQGTKVEEDNAD